VKQTGSHGNEVTCKTKGTVGSDVFYAVRAKRLCNEEAWSNNCTVALRVVGGDEKGTQCLGV
jgi:hypothetical protein